MPLRPLAWTGFAFLGAGVAMMFLGPDWRPYGCGSLLTAATVYAFAFWKVARQIAAINRRTQEMLERAAQEMEKRKR